MGQMNHHKIIKALYFVVKVCEFRLFFASRDGWTKSKRGTSVRTSNMAEQTTGDITKKTTNFVHLMTLTGVD